ncbi:MAG: xanthine dehydrogenase family protein subunit M [Desulfobulbaceae bacterium]|nr:xanthine dehydrogenase family protein subunit M [Desulfobulbaceae bacterium]
MLLPKFEYHEPLTVDEACRILGELGQKAKLLAGGTDLIVNMKKKVLSPTHVVSLSGIADLKGLDSANGTVKLGACLTASEIAQSETIQKSFSALCKGAASLGSPLIRNLATVAGNLVSARPAADFQPPLLAYGAQVVLVKSSGERVVPLSDFFKGPGQTVMDPDELLTQIILTKPPAGSGAGYFKLGLRKTLEISLTNAAAYLSLDPDGTIKTARIFLGSVAPTPLRSPSAEKVLTGEKPGEALFERAGEAAAGDSKPIDDFRASADYKKAMVAVLTKRALNMAFQEANAS